MSVRWHTAVIDPPWLERGGGKVKRGADRHYPLMSREDCYRALVMSGQWTPDEDAHLYLWVTNNFLVEGILLMGELGFRYVTNIAWVKSKGDPEPDADGVQIGLGQYFRGAHELCLFGVRGSGLRIATEARDIPSVIVAPRGQHSRKPEAFYDLVERRSCQPYLECFARRGREGWQSWGNEVTP